MSWLPHLDIPPVHEWVSRTSSANPIISASNPPSLHSSASDSNGSEFFSNANQFQMRDLNYFNGGVNAKPEISKTGWNLLLKMVAPSALYNSKDHSDPPTCDEEAHAGVVNTIMGWFRERDASKRLLCITGGAGTGKSAIQHTVARRCERMGILAATFFFSAADADRNEVAPLVATIAYQLALTSPALQISISETVERDPFIFAKILQTQMKALVVEPVRHHRASLGNLPYAILIDALDECKDERRQADLLAVIEDCILANDLPFRVFIASRPNQPLQNALGKPLNSETLHIALEKLGKEVNSTSKSIPSPCEPASTNLSGIRAKKIQESALTSPQPIVSQPEWFPSRPIQKTAEVQEMSFITMSTVDDLSYTPSEEQRSRDLAQINATGRRSWGTLKRNAEAVWSPDLEAVLIQALEQYQLTEDHKPTTSKHGIRFISQYIFEQTGKTRTHKQVGSRLQHLRDTTEDSRVLALIARGTGRDADRDEDDRQTPRSNPSSCSSSRNSSRNQSPSPYSFSAPPSPKTLGESLDNTLVLYTQITAEFSQPPPGIPRIQILANDISTPVGIPLRPTNPNSQQDPSSTSVLSMFSNTIHIYSGWELSTNTNLVIYKDERPVRQDKIILRPLSQPNEFGEGSWIYECDLGGSSWRTICDAQDPSRITMLQNLKPGTNASKSFPAGSSAPKVSIVYHFDLMGQTASSSQPRPLAYISPRYGLPIGSNNARSDSFGYASGYSPDSNVAQPSSFWDMDNHHHGRHNGFNPDELPDPSQMAFSRSYPGPSRLASFTQENALNSHPNLLTRHHSGRSVGHYDSNCMGDPSSYGRDHSY